MLNLIASFAFAASLASSVLAQPLPTSADHTRVLNEVVPANQATHLPVKSGLWSDSAVWQHGVVPKQGDTVLIPEGFSVTISGSASAHWCRIEGNLSFDSKAESLFRVETLAVDMPGSLEIGTPGRPIEKWAVVEFIDNGPIQDWAQLGRGLIVMGDFSVYGKETTGFVHVLNNPRKGDMQIKLAAAPVNWKVDSVIVVPGVRPPLTIPSGPHPPTPPEGRDPVFKKQHELRTITAIAGNTITLDTPLDYDLHHQTSGVNIPIGCLTRNVTFRSQSKEVSRRGHIMVMPVTPHEYTIANACFEDLGRTSQELFVTDPQQNLPASLANPRGRYALHFHKNGFATHATVKGCCIRDGLKWGFVNHSSNVDFLDCVAYDVHGAGFATEIGNEMGCFKRCLSVCNLGYGDLNYSPVLRPVRGTKKGRPSPTPEEKLAAPFGNDFGMRGSGFWYQSARTFVEACEAYGCAGAGHDLQPMVGATTDHLGRPVAIYVSDLTAEEKSRLITDPKKDKLTINSYPCTFRDNVAVGCDAEGLQDWSHPIDQAVGGNVFSGCVVRNCGIGFGAGGCAYIELEGDFVNDPSVMNGRQLGPTLDLYNRVDILCRNVKSKGFKVGIGTSHNGFTWIEGADTRLDCLTDIMLSKGTQEVRIGIDTESLMGNRKIVLDDGVTTRPVVWRRPGKPGLKLVPLGTPGGVAMPGLINCVAEQK